MNELAKQELDKKISQLEELSNNILSLSRNTILVNFRFLDLALSNFEFVLCLDTTIGTDGKHLFYNPKAILTAFKNEKEYLAHAYLHLVMHCVFKHQFIFKNIDRVKWNLACDIAVENAILELNSKATAIQMQSVINQELQILTDKIGKLTAERIYKYLVEKNVDQEEIARLNQIFLFDDHRFWYDEASSAGVSSEQQKDPQNDDDSNQKNKSQTGQGDGGNTNSDDDFRKEQEKFWSEVAERIQTDLETASKGIGDQAGTVMQNLKEINREQCDYADFLRKFATINEVMKINDDEFDYIFYTYGLNVYENMPLIEPLEYKDEKVIKEFVIAIDTSGSVQGELVEKFITKTYNILKSTESFASVINIHIVQCDAKVQHDEVITCEDDLENYIKNIKLFGFGGTDFRPVFEYVDKLIEDGQFTNLKGLIYFTDGFGVYPADMPGYETAFVFVDDDYRDIGVPGWAIKVVLKKEEIEEL